MRAASSIVALVFIFMGIAAAGVIPDIDGRALSPSDDNNGEGDHVSSRSGVRAHPSGSPTRTTHAISASVRSRSPDVRTSTAGAHPSVAHDHSIHPIPRRADPSGSSHSGSSFRVSDRRPTPSGGSSRFHPSASHGVHPADGHSRPLPTYSTNVSGTRLQHPASHTARSTEALWHHSGIPSGIPSGASDHLTPSIIPSDSGRRAHHPSSTSDGSIQPRPTSTLG